MARRWQKAVWAVLAGAALGVAGCTDSEPMYGAPVDVSSDEDVDGDEAQDSVDVLPEFPDAVYYGPPADT